MWPAEAWLSGGQWVRCDLQQRELHRHGLLAEQTGNSVLLTSCLSPPECFEYCHHAQPGDLRAGLPMTVSFCCCDGCTCRLLQGCHASHKRLERAMPVPRQARMQHSGAGSPPSSFVAVVLQQGS